jgi:citrate synthase
MVNLDFEKIFEVIKKENFILLKFKHLDKRLIIYDPGFYHTAHCWSRISKIDINNGKLYYRGISVDSLTESTFLSVAHNLIYPNCTEERESFYNYIKNHFKIYEPLKLLLDKIPLNIHPMEFLQIGIIALSALENSLLEDSKNFLEKTAFLIAQTSVISSYYLSKVKSFDFKITDPKGDFDFAESVIRVMRPDLSDEKNKKFAKILNTILIFHSEHGQNCSAATVRNIASAKTNIYNAIACGIAAFNGRLHGGASQAVSEMYDDIIDNNLDIDKYVDEKIKNKTPLMGFGQRTYNKILNCWDPRVENMLRILNDKSNNFPEIEKYKEIASKLIYRVTNDEYFISRNITPNPDLFNCIFYKLFGVPNQMNPMMIVLGRVSGWIANYKEHIDDNLPLARPCDIHITKR